MRGTRINFLVMVTICVTICCGIAQAQWETVATGIEYQQFHLDGPVNVFAVRADREKKNWTIDTCIGQGQLRSGRETVTELAQRYDESVNLRGELYDVKVAINGDYFSFETDHSSSGQIISGWLAKRFRDYAGGSGFVWTYEREAFLGGNVQNKKKFQTIIFSDSQEMKITNINTPRGEDELVLYTPHYSDRTHTSADGVEVVVRVVESLGVAAKTKSNKGKIVEIRPHRDSSLLPFDHVVLSGHGSAARKLLNHAKVGEELQFKLDLIDHGVNELPPKRWRNVRASLGGHFYCVMNGKVPADRWERKGKPGAVNRHPRTAVAFNDSYVYFVVADGRSKKSVGMTITELGNFCVKYLRASYAIAQDGGGSSTIWIDGKVVNVPSDGKQRPVANGYMMVLVSNAKKVTNLSQGDRFTTNDKVQLRLGPGTNYGIVKDVPQGQRGKIIEHQLNGIYAKYKHWRKCKIGKSEGWISEDRMQVNLADSKPYE